MFHIDQTAPTGIVRLLQPEIQNVGRDNPQVSCAVCFSGIHNIRKDLTTRLKSSASYLAQRLGADPVDSKIWKALVVPFCLSLMAGCGGGGGNKNTGGGGNGSVTPPVILQDKNNDITTFTGGLEVQ